MKHDKEYQEKLFSKRKTAQKAGDIRSPFIKRISRKYIGKKVLDVGSSNGSLIDLIPRAIGIDLAPNHPRVEKGDLSSMRFEDNSFDTVFALEVLEHLEDEVLFKGLKEINRVLKVGAYFVISVPYKENLDDNKVLCPKCNFWFHRRGHVRSFDEISIKKILEENNFKVLKIKILPLGSLAHHPRMIFYWRLFYFMGLGFKPNSLFVVAKK